MTRRIARRVLAVSSLFWVPWAVARVINVDALGWLAVAAQSALLYAAAVTALSLLACIASRLWPGAIAAAIGVVLLGIIIAPRATGNQQPTVPHAVPLTVMVMNLRDGHADPDSVLRLVKRQHVDTLSLVELSGATLARFKAHGLTQQLPHYQAVPGGTGSGGSGGFSRYPSAWDHGQRSRDHPWVASIISPPGAMPVRLETIHGYPPRPKTKHAFMTQKVFREQPDPLYKGIPAIIAGDFNATLDNRVVRTLLHRGYRDAADQMGAGLRPTWTGFHGLAALTIDHVLVAPTIAVRSIDIERVPGTDHRAVIVRLLVPGKSTPR